MTDPEVRILTVRQPWAWAIVQGGKDVENRTRNIAGDYRGLVAIHAAQALVPCRLGQHVEGGDVDFERYREGFLARSSRFAWPYRVPEHRGHIIGLVELTDVHPGGTTGCHPDASDPHRLAWCSTWALPEHQHLGLANARPLTAPIPYTGALGLRRLPDDVAAQVLANA